MVGGKTKKQKVAEDEKSNDIDSEHALSIEKLQQIQDELEKVNEEASEEVLEVVQKYNEIRKPVYVRRDEIIKSLPGFWSIAFMTHPKLGNLLNEEDQKIFEYMHSLEVKKCQEAKSGFTIAFNFEENPYFENTVLFKTYFCDKGITCVSGTTIMWREWVRDANKTNREKYGNKQTSTKESFLSWFGEAEHKEIEELHDEVAKIIKEDLWRNPLKAFYNLADEEKTSDGDEEKDSDGDEEKDSDGDEEEYGDGGDDGDGGAGDDGDEADR